MSGKRLTVVGAGTLPNAATDKGLPKPWKEDPDLFLSKLLFKEDELD